MRSQTVDIAKGIGIVLVVLGHNPAAETWGPVVPAIFSFHMPLFFMLSGVFLRSSDSLSRLLDSRFHSILKPYLVVGLAMGAAKLMGAFHAIRTPDEAWLYVAGLVYGTGSTVMWTPLWFLPHLFVATITTTLLVKRLQARPLLLATVLATLLAAGVATVGRVGELPWSADLLPLTVPFVALGWMARERLLSFDPRGWHVVPALLAFVSLHALFDAQMDLNLRRYDSLVACTTQAVLGAWLCLAAATALGRAPTLARWAAHVGAGSLFILVFHHPVQARALAALQVCGVAELPAALLAVAAGVLLPLVLLEAARRVPLLARLLLPRRAPGTPPAPVVTAATLESRKHHRSS